LDGLVTSGPIPRWGHRSHLVVVLAAVSGCIDAIGFVALGGAFTSVMTGNLVLSGVAAAHGDGELLLRVLAAIVAYVIGCAIGARISGRHEPAVAGAPPEHWPPSVNRALLLEFALIAVFSVGWWLTGSTPDTGLKLVLLVVNAAALGTQSALVTRFGVAGLSTTYLTGTLTTLTVRLAHRQPLGEMRLNGQLLAALVAGGVSGAALALYARQAAPVLPLVLVAVALLGGRRLQSLSS
jgi:uncharacterized membrane protein YoaK (UPF0700 family)